VSSGGGGGGGGGAATGGLPGFMSPRLSSPAHPTQGGGHRGGGGGGGGFRGGGRGRGRGGPNIGRDRELIGQTIKITQGPYKGHIGIVKVRKILVYYRTGSVKVGMHRISGQICT
jgi:transcription elongation factor SPT5